VVQNSNAAELPAGGIFQIGLPDLNRVAFPVKHHHSILVFKVRIRAYSMLVIGIQRGGQSP
jgi:hypothetical protein